MRRVGDFHARLRFAQCTIPEGKWRLLIVYSVKGDHHHHLSSWDPGAHVVQTNVCHSGLLLYRGRGNWVNFWQIYAAGISEPLPNYSLFCSQEDPISVAFEQKYFLQSQLTHFLSLFKPWILLFRNPQLPEFSHPQNPENVQTHHSKSVENAIPL